MKSRLKFGVLPLFLILLVTSTCLAKISVYVNEDADYSQDCSISLGFEGEGKDPIGVRTKLQQLLLTNGFNIVNNKDATHAMSFSYDCYRDPFLFTYRFRLFNSTIYEVGSGKIVASCDFNGDSSVDKVLRTYVTQLSKQLLTSQ